MPTWIENLLTPGPIAVLTVIGSTMLWIGCIFQVNLSITNSYLFRENVSKHVKDIAEKEELERRKAALRPFLWVPPSMGKVNKRIKEVNATVLTADELIEVNKQNRESTGWSCVLVAAIVALGGAFGTAAQFAPVGIVVFILAFVASCVAMVVRHQRDRKLFSTGLPAASAS